MRKFLSKFLDNITNLTKPSTLISQHVENVVHNKRLSIKIENLKKNDIFQTHSKKSEKLHIGIVADEFTTVNLSYEAHLIELTPSDYKQQIKLLQPNIIFIESAWFGKNSLWKSRKSIVGKKIFNLIEYCHSKNIICIYWGKEDPTDFSHFLPIAKLVDIIFTTDRSCLNLYKNKVKHDNVYLMQFAAQTHIHNPIETLPRKSKFFFAGAYYYKYIERQLDFKRIFDIAINLKQIDIFDRNYNSTDLHNQPFPNEFTQYVVGKISFNEIHKVYKSYDFAINVNTVKDSQTMCSRRIFELFASNTLLISNYSTAIINLLNLDILSSDNENLISRYLNKVCNDDLFAKKIKLICLRTVLKSHTYFDRIGLIKSVIMNTNYNSPLPHVLIFAKFSNHKEFERLILKFNYQTYKNISLLALNTNQHFDTINSNERVYLFNDFISIHKHIINSQDSFLTYFSLKDFYGENYILDLILSTKYSDCSIIGKGSYFTSYGKKINKLKNSNMSYKMTKDLLLRRSIVAINNLERIQINQILHTPETFSFNSTDMLSIDSFNYCQNGNFYYGHLTNNLAFIDRI